MSDFFERRPLPELVGLVHGFNHAWKRALASDASPEIAAVFRRRKGAVQLELLRDWWEVCELVPDPEAPGTYGIRLTRPVPCPPPRKGAWTDAAHVLRELVQEELDVVEDTEESSP